MLTRIAHDLSEAFCRVEFRKTGRVDAVATEKPRVARSDYEVARSGYEATGCPEPLKRTSIRSGGASTPRLQSRIVRASPESVDLRDKRLTSIQKRVDAAAAKTATVFQPREERRSARRADDLESASRRGCDADRTESVNRPRSGDSSTPRPRSRGPSGASRESVGSCGERASSV